MTSKQNDIEKVARALCEKYRGDPDIVHEGGQVRWQAWEGMARAAYLAVLDCLKEPSKEMLQATVSPRIEHVSQSWQAILAVKRKEIEDAE